MTKEEIKTLKLPGISTEDGLFEFTAKEKQGKHIEIIDYPPLLYTSRNPDLREKQQLAAERINFILLNTVNLKSYLQQEFYKNNVPKYYKYFEDWFSKLTLVQAEYFIAYSKNQKTIV